MSLIRRAITAPERRSLLYPESDPFSIPPPGSVGQLSPSGVLVNDENVMGLTTFWAGVRILSSTVATLNIRVFAENGNLRREVTPQPQIVANPFAQATLIEGLEQIMYSLVLRGNAYGAVTQLDAAGRPSQLFILHPDSVKVRRDDGGEIVYTVAGKDYDSSVIVHIKILAPPGGLKGLSLIDHARTSLGAGLAAEEFASLFYRQGALMSGFISVPEAMEPDDARLLNEHFKSRHTGITNAHSPAVLTGGATWQNISVTPEQAQFLATRQYSDSQIATLLGIPPHLLGLVDRTTSWGTGIETQGRAFIDYTLRNYLVRIEHALSAMLPPNQYVEFDTDSITRPTEAERYANYNIGLMGGFLCADEVRDAEGLAPLPNGLGATFRVLTTLAPVDAVDTEPDETDLPLVDPENPGAGPAIAPDDSPPVAA